MAEIGPQAVLLDIAAQLRRLKKRFALVGGLAVSLRAEVRFTRDVDVAVAVSNDAELESLVRELRLVGYEPLAVVEHGERERLATVRLLSQWGIVVDLIAASSGIEEEIVTRATDVKLGGGVIPVARPEELLAMKVLSMTDRRLQDRIDASSLLALNEHLDLHEVRANLAEILARGYSRDQDLEAKLASVLSAHDAASS